MGIYYHSVWCSFQYALWILIAQVLIFLGHLEEHPVTSRELLSDGISSPHLLAAWLSMANFVLNSQFSDFQATPTVWISIKNYLENLNVYMTSPKHHLNQIKVIFLLFPLALVLALVLVSVHYVGYVYFV